MVVAAHPLAVEAGLEILRAGGNAVDAAVAVQMALSLVEPQSSGLGGGAFLLYYDAGTRRVLSYDGRETAPAAARPDLFLEPDGRPMSFVEAGLGGRAVGVPGAVRALELAHHEHGHLPWARLFEPAIRMASDGFPVSERLASWIAADAAALGSRAGTRAYFLPDGAPLRPGALLRNPALAETLRRIAAEGADALLRGPVAADIAAAVRTDPSPGLLTTDDLAAYRARPRPPLCGPYRGRTVCGMGPPSAGGAMVLETLGLLAHFDVARLDPRGVDAAMLLTEAERLVDADRDRYLADTDYVAAPLPGLYAADYLMARAQLIDLDHAAARSRAGNPLWDRPAPPAASEPPQPEHGTSHLVVLDARGDAVSMTTTVEAPFGSHIMLHGFLLNNQLLDFSFRPEIDGRPVANRVEPGKRPRSSMAPTFVLRPDGTLEAALGSPGGKRIPGFVVQALVGLLDWRLDPQAAVSLPHVQSEGDTADLEAGTSAASLLPALVARDSPAHVTGLNSGLEAILLGPDGPVGGSDPRREGAARAP